MTDAFPTIEQLKRALAIQEQIGALKEQLQAVLSGSGASVAAKVNVSEDGRKGRRSAATRAKMAASQKARWAAKQTGGGGSAPTKKKRMLSEEARAKIAEAQKRRWASVKAGK